MKITKQNTTLKTVKNILTFSIFIVIVLYLSVAFAILPETKVSNSERRALKTFDDVKASEDPLGEFESYFLDQFPMRDDFRTVKAYFCLDVLRKNDNNKIYNCDGSIVKLEDTLDEKQMNMTVDLMNSVIEKYFQNNEVYCSVIPDKHYYASQKNGYPAMDYEKMFSVISQNTNAEYIDITGALSLSDYYTTDSHWSQEKILKVAQLLATEMSEEINVIPESGFKENTLEPFYGVYYGQSALNVKPDVIKYLTSENTDKMTMTVINDKGKPETYPAYTLDKFNGNDPYDIFTGGANPYVTIENPNSQSEKELILFRDSFGSSIAPIFAEGYRKVTMIDLRYMFPSAIEFFMGKVAEDTDVLFLYSTGLINGGGTLRGF